MCIGSFYSFNFYQKFIILYKKYKFAILLSSSFNSSGNQKKYFQKVISKKLALVSSS